MDDEQTILDLFRYIFEEAGHGVVIAKNGRDALAAINLSIPDFMVLDIAMPEMTGKELAVELKRLSLHNRRLAEIPFVVMTGENFMEGDNGVFQSMPGFAGFFPKMTPPDKILEIAMEAIV
ncbi:MAG: response regulator [Elusimicrobiales bacterium]|nr:response regulator [Elusimicrobiales bacterium]